jgi:7-cyano-7-deazaguanine synthase
MKNNKAIVVFSGGQDSTTCLYWALNRYKNVEAITFNYGQKHNIEIEQSKLILDKLGVKQTIVDLNHSLKKIADSALLGNKGDVSTINKYGLPSSFVPGRNGIFLYNTYVYALKSEADSIITGVCQTDYSGYPDCRDVFIQNLRKNMALGVFGNEDEGPIIETPLMFLDKADTFKLALDEGCLEEVIELSHTCYNGERIYKHEWGWSTEEGTMRDPLCPACELRAKGYYEFLNRYNR